MGGEFRLGSEGVKAQWGNGPNLLVIAATSQRVGIEATAGLANRYSLANGILYLGAGVGANASMRHHGSATSAAADETAAYDNRLFVREADALGKKIQTLTNGSYDLARIGFTDLSELVTRYPVLVRAADYNAIQKLQNEFEKYRGDFEEARVFLARGFDTDDFYNRHPDLAVLKPLLARPVTTRGLESLSVHDIRREAASALAALHEFDAKTGFISGAPDDAKVDAWLAERGLKRPATPEERSKFLQLLRRAKSELEQVPDYFSSLPSAAEVKQAHDDVKRILKIDPLVEASAYAAAAYAKPVGSNYAVLGGVAEAGRRLSTNGLHLERDRDDSVRARLGVGEFRRTSVVAGIGSHPAAAMPYEMVQRLGLSLPAAGNWGAYAGYREESERVVGLRLKNAEVSLGGTYVLRDGLYALVGISKPTNHDGHTKSSAALGWRF